MNNEKDSTWSPILLLTCALFIDIPVFIHYCLMPLLTILHGMLQRIYVTLVGPLSSMFA